MANKQHIFDAIWKGLLAVAAIAAVSHYVLNISVTINEQTEKHRHFVRSEPLELSWSDYGQRMLLQQSEVAITDAELTDAVATIRRDIEQKTWAGYSGSRTATEKQETLERCKIGMELLREWEANMRRSFGEKK